jgi:hypothetical protein
MRKLLWNLGAVVVLAGFSMASRAQETRLPDLFSVGLKRTQEDAKEAMRLAGEAVRHEIELLLSLQRRRVTGLADLYVKVLRKRMTRIIERGLERTRGFSQADVLAIGTAREGILKRVRAAARSSLQPFGGSVRFFGFFRALEEAGRRVWATVAQVAQGKAKLRPGMAKAPWEERRAAIARSLEKFRAWAEKAGSEAVRQALYEAFLVLDEGDEPLAPAPSSKAPVVPPVVAPPVVAPPVVAPPIVVPPVAAPPVVVPPAAKPAPVRPAPGEPLPDKAPAAKPPAPKRTLEAPPVEGAKP